MACFKSFSDKFFIYYAFLQISMNVFSQEQQIFNRVFEESYQGSDGCISKDIIDNLPDSDLYSLRQVSKNCKKRVDGRLKRKFSVFTYLEFNPENKGEEALDKQITLLSLLKKAEIFGSTVDVEFKQFCNLDISMIDQVKCLSYFPMAITTYKSLQEKQQKLTTPEDLHKNSLEYIDNQYPDDEPYKHEQELYLLYFPIDRSKKSYLKKVGGNETKVLVNSAKYYVYNLIMKIRASENFVKRIRIDMFTERKYDIHLFIKGPIEKRPISDLIFKDLKKFVKSK